MVTTIIYIAAFTMPITTAEAFDLIMIAVVIMWNAIFNFVCLRVRLNFLVPYYLDLSPRDGTLL